MTDKSPGLDTEQVKKAIQSLLKYVGTKESSDLFEDDDEFIYMQLALKKMPLVRNKDKPYRIPIPHPLFEVEGAEVCLFVKDHKGEGQKEAKQRLEQLESRGGIAKVIGISKLKTKYESFEAKRQLCDAYDLFLADDRVLPKLPKLIGKSFFKKKKQPVPVRLSGKNWGPAIQKALAATFMYLSAGTCISIRFARSSFSEKEVLANFLAVLTRALEHIPRKWKGVQAVFIKSAGSAALPVYQAAPDTSKRIAV